MTKYTYVKIYNGTIFKTLGIMNKQALLTGAFLSEWKKGNVVTIHGKCDKKQNVKSYCPVSLLPICRKIVRRLICIEIISFFSC